MSDCVSGLLLLLVAAMSACQYPWLDRHPLSYMQSVPASGCVAVPFNFVYKSAKYEAYYLIPTSMPAGCSETDIRWVQCRQRAAQS